MLTRAPRAGRIVAWTGVLVLLALSTPIVAFALLTFVDRSPPLDLARARDAQAIVILGGGIRREAAEYGGRDTLGSLTLERVRYGAQVARLTGLPVLVTGGSVLGGEPEATVMRSALEHEFRVPVRWMESQSRNTHENATLSAKILQRGEREPSHSRRAQLRHAARPGRVRDARHRNDSGPDVNSEPPGRQRRGTHSKCGVLTQQLLCPLRDTCKPGPMDRHNAVALALHHRTHATCIIIATTGQASPAKHWSPQLVVYGRYCSQWRRSAADTASCRQDLAFRAFLCLKSTS